MASSSAPIKFSQGSLTVTVASRDLKVHYVYPEELSQLTSNSNWFGLCSVFFGGVFGTAVTAWAAWITTPEANVWTSATFFLTGIGFTALSVFFGIALCGAYQSNRTLLATITGQEAVAERPAGGGR